MKNQQDSREQKIDPSAPALSRRKFFALGGMATMLTFAGNILPQWITDALPTQNAHAAVFGSTKSKNILIITGSARVGGNSDVLAEAFANGARESGHTVNVFHSGRDTVNGCLGCDACWSTGKPCVVEDNFDKLWPMLEQADMLVLSSPLYWYAMSGHIKNALDRMYAYSKKDKVRDLKIKEAMLLMCGESWLKKSFDGPAESYRQMLGFKGWKDRGRLFVTSTHHVGDMAGKSDLKTAEKMGRQA